MRELLLGDLTTKLGSLLMAILLWLYLFWQGHDEIVKDFPLKVDYPHATVARIRIEDDKGRPIGDRIELKIAATQSLAEYIEQVPVRCQITLPESFFTLPEEGTFPYSLGPSNLAGLPGRINVEFLSPVLTVRYWKFKTVSVPVTEGEVVEPPEGYARVGKFEFDPPEVKVRLAADLKAPASLRLAPLKLDRRTASCELDVRPQAPEGVELVTETVRVSVQIAPRPESVSIRPKIELVWAGDSAMYLWSLSREDARVKVTGLKDDVARLTDENCVLRVCVGVEDIPKPESFAGADSDSRILKDVQLRPKGVELKSSLGLELVDEIRITFKRKP